jgi:hypothetical protein
VVARLRRRATRFLGRSHCYSPVPSCVLLRVCSRSCSTRLRNLEHRGLGDQRYAVGLGIGASVSEEALLAVEIPDELFSEFEWIEERKGYREALNRPQS